MFSVNLCPTNNQILSPELKNNLVAKLQDYFCETEISFWESDFVTQSGKFKDSEEVSCPRCDHEHTVDTAELMQFNSKLAIVPADQIAVQMPCCHHDTNLAEMSFEEAVFSNWGITIKGKNRTVLEEFLHHQATPVALTAVEMPA
ncbi:hypothetical protein JCM19236_619 [Vibrio sp. JCM 19236]|nr:hypothetical protein JCM19236_619 [Vibrio sp. JCM 19236]